jgi:hypothetical protein
MNAKIKKKGLSAVVATVLIISIVVVSIAILARIAVPFVRESLDRSSECVGYEEAFSFDESLGYNCYYDSSGGGHINVSITSKIGSDKEAPAGFNLVFVKRGSSVAKKVLNGTETDGIENFDGTDKLKIPSSGETYTYKYTPGSGDKASDFFRAEVYPILKSGRVCEKKSDYVDLIACNSRRI